MVQRQRQKHKHEIDGDKFQNPRLCATERAVDKPEIVGIEHRQEEKRLEVESRIES